MRPGRLATARLRVTAGALLGLALFGALFPRPARAQEAGGTVYPRSSPPESHLRAHLALAAGVALSASSFVVSAAADRAYERYKGDTDPVQIERDYDAARLDDHWSAGLLLAGTGALALGVYWRFIRHPEASRAARLGVAPSVTARHAGLALRVDLP